MRNGRVVWTSDSLTHGLIWFKANVEAEILRELEQFAQECEAYMKANAPWDDRTGDARGGLTAEADQNETKGNLGVVLAHGVDYGVYLEFKFGGRDAIITPTMEVMGPQLMMRMSGLLDRVDYQGIP